MSYHSAVCKSSEKMIGLRGPFVIVIDKNNSRQTHGMIRPLVFCPLYPPYSGGSPTYFSNLLKMLPDDHHPIVLTAHHPDEPLVVAGEEATIYRTIPWLKSLPDVVQLAVESVTGFLVSVYLLLAKDIDVAHLHATSYATPAIAVAATLTGVPLIFDCRDLDFPPVLARIWRGQHWFSCSPDVDDVLTSQSIPPDRIIRVPIVNPPYVPEFADPDIWDASVRYGESSLDIVYVGALRKEKGVWELLDAFEQLIDGSADAELHIVGDGPLREDIVRSIHERGFADAVEMTGSINHRVALSHIAAADVLVNPSYGETGPRSLLEALAVGTPVVTTAVGVARELVEDGQSGLVVNPHADDILAALKTIETDCEVRERLSSQGFNALACRDWRVVTDAVKSGYERANIR